MKLKNIYIICGKARSGKDTLVDLLKEYYTSKNKKYLELKYTFYLRKYTKNITGWDGSEDKKPRSFMQEIGTLIRDYDNLYFSRRMLEDLYIYKDYYDVIFIDDTRMVNEIKEIKKVYPNSITILIKRDTNELTNQEKHHITETSLDDFHDFDYVIDNNHSLDELKNNILKIVSEVENEEINK